MMHFPWLIVVFLGTTITTTANNNVLNFEKRDLPPSNQIQIVSVNYAGSGCPAGSAVGILSDDKTLLTALFDSYIARSGSNVPPTDYRKNCQMTVKLRLPHGWQFSVVKADYRGSVSLPAGAHSYCQATYYFSGVSQENTVTRRTMFVGAISARDYFEGDEFGLQNTVWSPCVSDVLLNIKTEVAILPIGLPQLALMTVDSSGQKFEQLNHLQWRRC